MKKYLIISILTLAATVSSAPSANAGSCNYSYQYDRAGNICGDRAANVRSGGAYGGYKYIGATSFLVDIPLSSLTTKSLCFKGELNLAVKAVSFDV